MRQDAERWHVDPMAARRRRRPNAYAVGPASGPGDFDAAAPEYDLDAASLGQAFDAVAMAEPRVRRIAGAPGDPWVSYEQRSRFLRFPDYVSVRFLDLGEGRATLAVLSRSRFGYSDLGVNRQRVEKWLAGLAAFAR